VNTLLLKAQDIFYPASEGNFSSRASIKEARGKHCHDFYEFFIVVRGMAFHNVNGYKSQISEGTMVFVRPTDIHFYEMHDSDDCSYVNIAFLRELAEGLFSYVGKGYNMRDFLDADKISAAQLPIKNKNYLVRVLDDYVKFPNSRIKEKNTMLRVLLAKMLEQYFLYYTKIEDIQTCPVWLRKLYDDMSKPDFFLDTTKNIKTLTDMSREHVTREFKKYFNSTPTDYINYMKLEYAAQLLKNTDMDVIDICYECGYDGLSYFYKMFKNKYNLTPGRYREHYANKSLLI